MSRAYPMFGVRMPPELKTALERESKINLRSLNAEIVDRLTRSLEKRKASSGAAETQTDITASQQSDITDLERQLLALFRAQRPDKQLALIAVLT